MPGDINGDVTPEMHNHFGDDPAIQARSPYTSWTHNPGLALGHAGDDGLILRVETGAPSPGDTWHWEYSPNDWGDEMEVLLHGRREGCDVLAPAQLRAELEAAKPGGC